MQRFQPLFQVAQGYQIPVRGYISCVLGCPYQGHVEPSTVTQVAKKLIDLGCFEISLGDTIGVGTSYCSRLSWTCLIDTYHYWWGLTSDF